MAVLPSEDAPALPIEDVEAAVLPGAGSTAAARLRAGTPYLGLVQSAFHPQYSSRAKLPTTISGMGAVSPDGRWLVIMTPYNEGGQPGPNTINGQDGAYAGGTRHDLSRYPTGAAHAPAVYGKAKVARAGNAPEYPLFFTYGEGRISAASPDAVDSFPGLSDSLSMANWGGNAAAGIATGKEFRGLSASATRLYASNVTDDCIEVWDYTDLTATNPINRMPHKAAERIAFARPGRMGCSAAGILWVVRRPEEEEGYTLVRVDPADGAELATINTLPAVQSVDVGEDGRLRLTFREAAGDYFPGTIYAFDAETGDPIGSWGRLLADANGVIGPNTLERYTSVFTRADGVLYTVGYSARFPQNQAIRRFLFAPPPPPPGEEGDEGEEEEVEEPEPSAEAWEPDPDWPPILGGLAGDNLVHDPADPDSLYSSHQRLSRHPDGSWLPVGLTVDAARFPTDARHNIYVQGSAWTGTHAVVTLAGHKFLVTGLGHTFWFRLGDEGMGELAVPCAAVWWRNPAMDNPSEGWPPGDLDGAQIWRDLDGDGEMEAGEYEAITGASALAGGPHAHVDPATGDIYYTLRQTSGATGKIYVLRCLGVEDGVPVFATALEEIASPWLAWGANGVAYVRFDFSDGSMAALLRRQADSLFYLCYWPGYLRAPHSEVAPLWANGLVATNARNFIPSGNGADYDADQVGGLALAGGYIFAVEGKGCGIRIYRRPDGRPAGRLTPHPGHNFSTPDNPTGLMAWQDAEGRYWVAAQSFNQSANALYVWGGGAPETSAGENKERPAAPNLAGWNAIRLSFPSALGGLAVTKARAARRPRD